MEWNGKINDYYTMRHKHNWNKSRDLLALSFNNEVVNYLDGVQLLAIPPDDLINTALLAPAPSPSDPAPEDDDELSRFLRISRFKFPRLLEPLLVAHVSDLVLLLDALKGIPPPFAPPPIPRLLLDRRV